MDSLRKSIGGGAPPRRGTRKKSAKKVLARRQPQKDMLMPIAGRNRRRKPPQISVVFQTAGESRLTSARDGFAENLKGAGLSCFEDAPPDL